MATGSCCWRVPQGPTGDTHIVVGGSPQEQARGPRQCRPWHRSCPHPRGPGQNFQHLRPSNAPAPCRTLSVPAPSYLRSSPPPPSRRTAWCIGHWRSLREPWGGPALSRSQVSGLGRPSGPGGDIGDITSRTFVLPIAVRALSRCIFINGRRRARGNTTFPFTILPLGSDQSPREVRKLSPIFVPLGLEVTSPKVDRSRDLSTFGDALIAAKCHLHLCGSLREDEYVTLASQRCFWEARRGSCSKTPFLQLALPVNLKGCWDATGELAGHLVESCAYEPAGAVSGRGV